jgi:hypothetical protein
MRNLGAGTEHAQRNKDTLDQDTGTRTLDQEHGHAEGHKEPWQRHRQEDSGTGQWRRSGMRDEYHLKSTVDANDEKD